MQHVCTILFSKLAFSPEKTREDYFPAKRRVLKKTTVYSVSSVSTKNDACRVYGVTIATEKIK